MSNPTSNYSFQMPTSTDLVTDLPADFEVFGQAVDTQMKTNADAAIAKTIVDAKGDLIAATAADTVARLAVGTNDQVLMADSTTATGLKWGTAAAGGMTLISTTTLSGASITLSSIPQTYKHLQILVQNSYASLTSALQLRLNSDTTASNYFYVWNGGSAGTYAGNNGNGTDAFMYFANQQDTNTFGRKASAVLNLHRYTDATAPQYVSSQSYGHQGGTSGSAQQGRIMNGIFNKSAAITSITILTDSGTFSGGTVYLYGVS